MFFAFLGKLLFPRQQEWEQQRNAKTITVAVVFGLGLGLLAMKLIRMMYYARH